ncbi:glutamine synthetase family protein [Subtercola endophyticus]|uniref:glutamine synthetase family protein n=1 Tax=Subtercola endophyticus TaxID=2895559 RepID=UPI001E28DF0A|nr:glutamine synthetase family protein [Subtercola endophyticus]UFS58658.1 glutamine synthetase family protein [Subtercola endophyticus]
MRNVDERAVAEGGGGITARPMLASERGGFIDRHDLWSEAQYAAAGQLRRVVDEVGIELIRISFVDQHGVLRGKTVTRDALPGALRSGITAPSSLLLKDSSGKSAYAVFEADPGVGTRGFAGAGDIVLVPDPTTFRVVPWAPKTASLLCDLRFPDGSEVPYCTRSILRRAVDVLAEEGYALTVGAELEFHVFRAVDVGVQPGQIGKPGAPGEAPTVAPVSPGSQLLHEETLDSLDDLVQALNHNLNLLDLPLRSIELEFGPNQLEITMAPGDAREVADAVVLARTAIRQVCRRLGYHATFMSRPQGAETASVGWHLHQSLTSTETGASVFPPSEAAYDEHGRVLSETGLFYLAGLLEHAHATAPFTTPTVNGYKRYQPFSLAPDRVVWGIDNKGAMIRAIGRPGDAASRLENRSGEPAANPYLYIASQIAAGLDGINRQLEPAAASENPYSSDAVRLPRTLGVALDALEGDSYLRSFFGADVIQWYLTLKRSEFDRYQAAVTDWEQREYFTMM